MRRLNRFFATESAGGVVMIVTAMLALIFANGTTADIYKNFINTPIGFSLGESSASEPLKVWVKDILMVFFFLMVGMELKRETVDGFLSDRKQILLPLVAAVGGMFVPALIFLAINHEFAANLNGWAIPSATDIAFAICILLLAGKHIPPALKIFLLAIAIFDDLGAILVIAFFYSSGLAVTPLLLVVAGILCLIALNRSGVTAISAYIAVGVFLWFCLYFSGIHTTIGGVLIGMAIPMRDPGNESHSPLNSFLHALHPWVSFLVLPIFAFTAAGINLKGMSFANLFDPIALGVAAGLFFGKQIGIFGTTWLLVKTGIAKLPEGTKMIQIYGVSILAGIGFTMSLFVGALAFSDVAMQDEVKLGVLFGSLLSIIVGWSVLRLCK